MRKLISCLLIAFLTFGLVIHEASAGRFGGGRRFCVQRSHSSLFSPRSQSNSQFFGQRSNAGKWGSALGGLVAGGLLASLFMGHGLGSGLLSWLLIGGLAFFVFGFLRKRMQPAFQTAHANSFQQNGFSKPSDFQGTAANNTYSSSPAGFVPETFLRAAKVTFIRLQAAYDQKNLQDLAEFTAPDVYAEIKMQLDERNDALNNTEVVSIEAVLLNAEKQANGTIASVRFTGFIKENNDPMKQLDEIWHFRQFSTRDNWLVAGIQQEVVEPVCRESQIYN